MYMYMNLLGPGHVLIVEEPLSLGQSAQDHMLILLRHLLLHLHLQPPQQEWPEDLRSKFTHTLMYMYIPSTHPHIQCIHVLCLHVHVSA